MSDPVRGLAYPVEKGFIEVGDGDRAAFLRAEASPKLDAFANVELHCEQTFEPAFTRLQNAGRAVSRRLEGQFQLALCLLTKDKTESLGNIARAWSLLTPGGLMMCAGLNELGAKSIERQVRDALGGLEAISKFHGRTFWARRGTERMPDKFADWQAQLEQKRIPGTDFIARPGIYGWRQIDEGSELLSEHLPDDLQGMGADLGAGWGFLSASVLQTCPRVTAIDLYDAEWLALEAAHQNIQAHAAGRKIGFHWHDVRNVLPQSSYRWIVMNPPFHAGKRADLTLGRAFIAAAAAALAPDGRLFMVANRHLPYEADLEQQFRDLHVLTSSTTFKVIEARRPTTVRSSP